MDCKNTQLSHTRSNPKGFTLVELLVVIVIIAVLAALSFGIYRSILEKSRNVQALTEFRGLSAGLRSFIGDYQKPPLPTSERASGTDVVYGAPDSQHKNDFVMAALMPADFHTKDMYQANQDVNPRGDTYFSVPFVDGDPAGGQVKNGLGKDGILYDPWGRSVMIAVNAPPFNSDTPANGVQDKILYTSGYAEYSDVKPREQDYVIWSYGKDGKKGKEGSGYTAVIPFSGSDDVKLEY